MPQAKHTKQTTVVGMKKVAKTRYRTTCTYLSSIICTMRQVPKNRKPCNRLSAVLLSSRPGRVAFDSIQTANILISLSFELKNKIGKEMLNSLHLWNHVCNNASHGGLSRFPDPGLIDYLQKEKSLIIKTVWIGKIVMG